MFHLLEAYINAESFSTVATEKPLNGATLILSDTVLLDVCGVTIVTFRDCDLLNNYFFLARALLSTISLLQQGAFFEDSYYTNGEPVGYGKAIIATGQFLTILKLKQNQMDQNQYINAIFSLQLNNTTNADAAIYNGAWDWSPNSTLIESMATVIVIHSLIITPEMIPKTNPPHIIPQFPFQTIIFVMAVIIIALALPAYYLTRKRKIKEQLINDHVNRFQSFNFRI